MKLATIRRADGTTTAARVEADGYVPLPAGDVGELLAAGGLATANEVAAEAISAADVTLASLVTNPSKVVCVGLNYKNHILEMGRDLPEYPTLFCKFADCLIGAGDDIHRPVETECFDWEVELAIVIGRKVRRANEDEAAAAIAGFTVLNDVTCRDWQFRTREWLQGKNWEATTPLGPHLVTPDELPGGVRPQLAVRCELDGEVMQEDTTADLLFDPVHLVQYISTIVSLNPGDVIATGTPGGVGHARKPPRYMAAGQRLVTEIEGLGRLENLIVSDPA